MQLMIGQTGFPPLLAVEYCPPSIRCYVSC
jgi:hypothetical protein